MMIEEFEQRTGYFPSSAEYKAIEAAYMEFDGDKDEFCKAYKKNANGIAERIRREVNAAAFKESRQHTADLTRRDIEIERLKKQLEREQEWKPYEDADAVSQADYDELATSGGTDKMTDDEEAIERIAEAASSMKLSPEAVQRILDAFDRITETIKDLCEWAAQTIRTLADFFTETLGDFMLRRAPPKWRHYALHAKRARVRKKYRNRIRRAFFAALASEGGGSS